ncbi:polysaccharide deacetylase family protein [Roseisolibacter agri]|uniref:NodB homology domain-containing protein n=1 Tax=Roseisolibacter agri TaxID=2014610 RepID=A0AA37QC98_9BACT|nr:polysaccharide deacetylase family protein [Roseisolibacter agri]GLC24063.1 hypothetical protein rosag_05760 [Roseisolibacter agri]
MRLLQARHLFLRLANSIGATSLVARSDWRRHRLVILCYHGISLDDEHQWNPELYMPAAQFRDRMRRLREARYNVLPLSDAVERLYEGNLPPKSVAVTFDDGYYDFHAQALPVLREFDIPATNFVATFYSNFVRPVFDPASAYLLWKGRARGVITLGAVIPGAASMPIVTAEERTQVWRQLREHAFRERLSAQEKDELLADLAMALGIDYQAWTATRMLQQMRESELRALPSDLVDVQLHTHRHRMPDDRALFMREIADNRESLDAMVTSGEPRAHFCYPLGNHDMQSVRWLAEMDVRSATTSDPDICTPADHPLLLPRFTDTTLQPDEVFDGWVSGFYPRLRWSPSLRELRRRRRTVSPPVAEPTAARPLRATLSDVVAR